MKYLVKDTDEGIEVIEQRDEDIVETEELQDEASLTEEEIAALKSLAAVAPKLVALVHEDVADEDTDEDLGEGEIDDEDEDELIDDEDEEEEEVLDTDEDIKKTYDSKKSIGAIQKKKTANDSITDDVIAEAWAKRYGG